MDKALCSCCDRKTCPKNQISIQDEVPSSQQSLAPDYSDKETQRTTTPSSAIASDHNSQTTSEYHAQYRNLDIDMKSVYRSMENPRLFRGCLMHMALVCRDLVEVLRPVVPKKHKVSKERLPRNIRLGPIHFEIPLEICVQDDTTLDVVVQESEYNEVELQKTCHSDRKKRKFPQLVEEYAAEQPLREPSLNKSDIFKSCESLEDECLKCIQSAEAQTEVAGGSCLSHILKSKTLNELPSKKCLCNKSKSKERVRIESTPPAKVSVESRPLITLLAPQTIPVPTGIKNVSKDIFEELNSKIEPDLSRSCDCGREKLLPTDLEKLSTKRKQTLCEFQKCACDWPDGISSMPSETAKPKPPTPVYRKAYPQHKDIDVCIKCRFDPSPLLDQDGRVFCPGNCGCCLCPWTPPATRSLEDVLRHNKIKVCKCRNRGTIFTDFSIVGSACSQVSYFDMCPCREKAEAKYLEVFGLEMWNKHERLRNIKRGEQVHLKDVKEIAQAKPESAATSETHLNRNNENLSTTPPPPTLPSPTNVPQFNQTDCANYPSIMSKVTRQQGYLTPQCQCMQASICREQTSTYLPDPCEISSSDSTTSDHFPIRLILNMKSHDVNSTSYPIRAEDIIIPETVTRPERLRPCNAMEPTFPMPKTAEYYSCNSESSDTETLMDSCAETSLKPGQGVGTRNDRDCAVLQLLHQVLQLMKEDRKESTKAPKDSSSKTSTNKTSIALSSSSSKCQQPKKAQQVDPSGPCGALRSLLDEHKDTIASGGPCAELRNVLSKSEETQSTSDDCTKMSSKCGTKEDPTLTTSTIETAEDDCDCNERSTECKTTDVKAHQPLMPPCPCYRYFMALMASSQGMPISFPVSEGADIWSSLKMPVFPGVEIPQTASTGDCRCDVEKPIEIPETIEDRDIESAKDSTNASKSQQGPLSEERSYISKDNAALLDAAKNQPLTRENGNREIDVSPAILDENSEKLNADEETPRTPRTPRTNDTMTPKRDDKDYEQTQDLALYHIERLGSTLAKSMYLRPPNLLDITEVDEGEIGDYLMDNFCEELDDESELAKEKRAESRKRKDPCDCCHCRETVKGKCMSIARSQQLDTENGVNEFKYFIDSIILDLDAMEHARRKCDVIKNVCRSKTGVCSRESFPVTIVDVQDLGATSLYVKWTIHDCYGIGGYEIYVDGYLTNRYYHSRHEAAVVTDVDITIPHKISLVAQPSLRDDSLKMLCSPHKKSNTKCQTKAGDQRKAYTTTASHWTPSIYLYDPAESKVPQLLPTIKYTT